MKLKSWFLAFVLGVFLTACGSSSPEDIALDFTKGMYKGDKGITKYIYLKNKDGKEEPGAKEFVEGKIAAGVAHEKEQADAKGGVKEITITNKEIEKDSAKVELTTTFKDKSTKTNNVYLHKQEGKWFVDLK